MTRRGIESQNSFSLTFAKIDIKVSNRSFRAYSTCDIVPNLQNYSLEKTTFERFSTEFFYELKRFVLILV